ncbi:MAG: thiol reductant ABC exporter subunit CydD [Anaerolineales bacterium]
MKLDRRLLSSAGTAHMPLALTIALGTADGIIIVFQAWAISRIVNAAFLTGAGIAQVQSELIILLLLSLLQMVLSTFREVTAQRAANLVKSDIRSRLLSHLLALGPAYTTAERSGELTNTIQEGVEALDAYIRQYLPQLALAAIVPLAIFLFILPVDLLSAFVLLLTAPLIPIFMVLIGDAAEVQTRRQWSVLSGMSATFLDAIQGLTTLKLLGRSRAMIAEIANISDRFRHSTMRVLRVAFLSAFVLEMVATISTAVVAVEIGLRLLYGRIEFEQAFFVLLLAPAFYLPLRLLGTRFHSGMSGIAAAQRIFDILDQPAPAAKTDQPDDHQPLEFHEAIEFRDVRLAYEDGKRIALDGVTFTIPQGKIVGVVGPTGGGKSTLAHLLLRFAEPGGGEILIDGMPLEDIDAEAWRRLLSWVPQQPYIFNTSASKNIRFARPQALIDEIETAAERAGAHNFIGSLPQGYDTILGEGSSRLSGGEAQRIAIARAFLKESPIIILDEVTAHLDAEIEAEVLNSLRDLLSGRTALIIAHRLQTVLYADEILVLSRGQIIERGTHEELLQAKGLYAEMIAAGGAS